MSFELTEFKPVHQDRENGEYQAVVVTGWGWFKRERLYRGEGTGWYLYKYSGQPVIPWTQAPGNVAMFLAAAWAARRWVNAGP